MFVKGDNGAEAGSGSGRRPAPTPPRRNSPTRRTSPIRRKSPTPRAALPSNSRNNTPTAQINSLSSNESAEDVRMKLAIFTRAFRLKVPFIEDKGKQLRFENGLASIPHSYGKFPEVFF